MESPTAALAHADRFETARGVRDRADLRNEISSRSDSNSAKQLSQASNAMFSSHSAVLQKHSFRVTSLVRGIPLKFVQSMHRCDKRLDRSQALHAAAYASRCPYTGLVRGMQ
eukprot:6199744-Pleurochrysis_carterae.AAC.4